LEIIVSLSLDQLITRCDKLCAGALSFWYY